jgi:hypothetical protein
MPNFHVTTVATGVESHCRKRIWAFDVVTRQTIMESGDFGDEADDFIDEHRIWQYSYVSSVQTISSCVSDA